MSRTPGRIIRVAYGERRVERKKTVLARRDQRRRGVTHARVTSHDRVRRIHRVPENLGRRRPVTARSHRTNDLFIYNIADPVRTACTEYNTSTGRAHGVNQSPRHGDRRRRDNYYITRWIGASARSGQRPARTRVARVR